MSELRVGALLSHAAPIAFNNVNIAGSISVEDDIKVEDEFAVSGSGRIKCKLEASTVNVPGSLNIERRAGG